MSKTAPIQLIVYREVKLVSTWTLYPYNLVSLATEIETWAPTQPQTLAYNLSCLQTMLGQSWHSNGGSRQPVSDLTEGPFYEKEPIPNTEATKE